MVLAVRTRSGQGFNRCGMRFGAEPSVVEEKILDAKFDSPVIHRKSPTIHEVLLGEQALLCQEVSAEEAAKLPAAVFVGKAG